MAWEERWRENPRPEPGEIDSAYGVFETRNEGGWMLYFGGGFLGFYVLLEWFGSWSVVLLGLPLLTWITLGVSIFFFLGLLGLMGPRKNEQK